MNTQVTDRDIYAVDCITCPKLFYELAESNLEKWFCLLFRWYVVLVSGKLSTILFDNFYNLPQSIQGSAGLESSLSQKTPLEVLITCAMRLKYKIKYSWNEER